MTNLLHLDSTVSGNTSVSRRLSQQLVEGLTTADTTVVHRDLTGLPVLTAERFAAAAQPVGERTPAEAELAAVSDQLIAELAAADLLVIAAPVYNFGVPSAVKAWMDLVARAGATFRYTDSGPEGLLKDKRAFIVSASGGVPFGSDADFATPHLRTFLTFLGIADVTLVGADSLMQDATSLDKAEGAIRELVGA